MGTPVNEVDFFKAKMAKTPVLERGNERIVKRGDCLWSIAEEKLGKNAKKSEILDYVYEIAKLNNFKSLEEMNHIKRDDKIYLPKGHPVGKTNPQGVAAKKTVTKPEKRQSIKLKTNAEEGFEILRNNILNTPTQNLHVSCGYRDSERANYAIALSNKDSAAKKTFANITTDRNGNIINIAFNGKINEVDIRYDYTVNKNGQIIKSDEFKLHSQIVGKIDKNELKEIENVLKQKIKELNTK